MSRLLRLALLFSLVLLAGALPLLAQAPAPAQPAAPTAQQAQPDSQAYSLPADKLAKAVTLNRIRVLTSLGDTLWGVLIMVILLATRAFAGIERWVEGRFTQRWISGLFYFAIFFLISTLAGLPIAAYSHHVSVSYGISVQSWDSWTSDQLKVLALTLLIGSPVLLLFSWVTRRWPRRYWLGLWLVCLPMIVIGNFAEPLFEPIFNQFEPLAQSNPALVAELQKVVARTGTRIAPERMFLMKASLKTNGLNAYVSGFGATKRVVVWDTTAGRIPNDQVQFIFGHESGHYVLHHIPKGMALTAIFLFFLFWICAAISVWLTRRYGPAWGIEAPASRTALLVLVTVLSVAGFFFQPIGAATSRFFEREADIYGQEAVHGLVADPQKTAVASFNSLGEAWLEDPNPHPFIEFWSYSHPSVQSRARFAIHYDPWINGGRGKFFAQ